MKAANEGDPVELTQVESEEVEDFEITKKIIKELMYNGADRTLTVRLIYDQIMTGQ